MKGKKELFEKLIIEKLSQLENNELDDYPAGKKLAELMREDEEFVKIYEDYKNEITRKNTV